MKYLTIYTICPTKKVNICILFKGFHIPKLGENCPKIYHISSGKTRYPVSQFADATSLILDSRESCLKKIFKFFINEHPYPTWNVDTSKTDWISKGIEVVTLSNIKIKLGRTYFTILVVIFTHNLSAIVERNYKDKLKIKHKKIMALFGRMTV